jgi:hypothetical protein
MSRVPIDTRLALRRRPKRARWSPWRRTLVVEWTLALSCAAIVLITVLRGIIR